MSRSLILFVALCVALCAAEKAKLRGPLSQQNTPSKCEQDAARLTRLPATIQKAGLSTLSALLQRLNLVDALNGVGPFTVFGPSNDAFSNANLVGLTDAQLTQIVLYHAISGNYLSTDLPFGTTPVTTLGGAQLSVTRTASGITINGYATVTAANVRASNGVLHIIDHVLIPPCGPNSPLPTIAALAASSPNLSTLYALVTDPVRASLAAALSSPGAYTLFAPLNSAFAAISGVVAGLNSTQVTQVLLYHALGARVLSSDLPLGTINPTTLLAPQTVQVTRNGAGVFVKGAGNAAPGAQVVVANVQACNGVVHVVNQVLIPSL